jgi:hypothetical protein
VSIFGRLREVLGDALRQLFGHLHLGHGRPAVDAGIG